MNHARCGAGVLIGTMAAMSTTGTPENPADTLRRLYEEHVRARFPEGLRDDDPSGVEATILDADLSGLVETWLHGGRIGPAERSVAHACLQDLDRLLPGLTDPHERRYVGRLRELAGLLAGAGG
jgi:hypothetical protein